VHNCYKTQVLEPLLCVRRRQRNYSVNNIIVLNSFSAVLWKLLISLEPSSCSYTDSSQDLELKSRIQSLIHFPVSILFNYNHSLSVNKTFIHFKYKQTLIQQTPPSHLLSRLSENPPFYAIITIISTNQISICIPLHFSLPYLASRL
jgi:hypothetical protein